MKGKRKESEYDVTEKMDVLSAERQAAEIKEESFILEESREWFVYSVKCF